MLREVKRVQMGTLEKDLGLWPVARWGAAGGDGQVGGEGGRGVGEVWQGMLSPESSHDAALRAEDTDGHGGDRTGVRQPPPRSASSAGGFNHPERQRLRASFTDTPVGSCAHAARPGSWSQVPTSPLQGEGRAAPRAAVSTAGAQLPRQMGTRQRARAARGCHLGKAALPAPST